MFSFLSPWCTVCLTLLDMFFSQDSQNQALPGQETKAKLVLFHQWIRIKPRNKVKYNSKGRHGGEGSWVC